jgi:hypothetical protein
MVASLPLAAAHCLGCLPERLQSQRFQQSLASPIYCGNGPVEAVKVDQPSGDARLDDAAAGGCLFQCCRIADERTMDTYE